MNPLPSCLPCLSDSRAPRPHEMTMRLQVLTSARPCPSGVALGKLLALPEPHFCICRIGVIRVDLGED